MVCCKEESKRPHAIFVPLVSPRDERTHKVNVRQQRHAQRTHLLHRNSEQNAICVTVRFRSWKRVIWKKEMYSYQSEEIKMRQDAKM